MPDPRAGHPSVFAQAITPYRWIAGSSPAMTVWLFCGVAFRPANALGQFRDKRRDGLDRLSGRLALLIETVPYRIDQRRADHHALGAFGDSARLLSGADTEANRDRQLG